MKKDESPVIIKGQFKPFKSKEDYESYILKTETSPDNKTNTKNIKKVFP